MLLDYSAYREIWLVFMNTEFIGDAWLKDGFKHVYAIERQALGWLCTDPSKSDIHTYILPASFDSDVIGEFKRRNPTFTVMHLKIKSHYDSVYPQLGVLSCVSIMQYMLGVFWPFVFTPYQLYNKLKKKPPNHIEVIGCQSTSPEMQKTRQEMPPQPQTIKEWS